MLNRLKKIITHHPKKATTTTALALFVGDLFGMESGAAEVLIQAVQILWGMAQN